MKSPAEKINPHIGSISHMLTSTRPMAFLPHSPARNYPFLGDCSDYYCNDVVKGFPLGRTVFIMPGTRGTHGFENTIDHSRESLHPYGGEIELEKNNITVQYTVTRHGYADVFNNTDCVLLTFPNNSTLEIDNGIISIFVPQQHKYGIGDEYIVLHCSVHYVVIKKTKTSLELRYDKIDSFVEFFAAVSYISIKKAIEIFKLELEGKTFEELYSNSKNIWDKLLGRIEIKGNTEDKQTVFYTALHRAFLRAIDYGEYGSYYSGYDNTVHSGKHFYTNDGIWDTFRCMHPLQLLLEPSRQADILESLNEMYRQSGWMPCFPLEDGDAPIMIGFHAAALFADACAKGLSVDYETAYEGIKKSALNETMLPWRCGIEATEADKCYYENGFFPALKKGESETLNEVHPFEARQSVAVTLEHAYDDWCTAVIARHLGKKEDEEFFLKRSKNYKNLYNEKLSLMAPKSSDGNWVEDFDAIWSGGMGGREYTTENNTWTYTWSVFHDLRGLFELMGGKKKAGKQLDMLFTKGLGDKNKFAYLGQFPDSTGLMGQFAMGNEPSFHIPYIYDYIGRADTAQKRLRDLMDIWFVNSPTGICGDEDGGAMSSWLVFSALGFYPVCPGSKGYAIGTPLFDEAKITLENGNEFKVESQGAGDGARYIQSASLNGRELKTPFITHDALIKGGTLILNMGRKPSGWFESK